MLQALQELRLCFGSEQSPVLSVLCSHPWPSPAQELCPGARCDGMEIPGSPASCLEGQHRRRAAGKAARWRAQSPCSATHLFSLIWGAKARAKVGCPDHPQPLWCQGVMSQEAPAIPSTAEPQPGRACRGNEHKLQPGWIPLVVPGLPGQQG